MRSTQSRLVFQPDSYRSLQDGAELIVNAIRPTLGPLPRTVAIHPALDTRFPELLDSGGTIAKRIIQIGDLHADVGAMYVRDMLWELQEQEGDGTATAAVLFQSVFAAGVRHVAAGYNARLLQSHLDAGVQVIVDELGRMTRSISGKAQLARVANTVCHDAEVSEMLGEIFDIVGEHGRLDIRSGSGRELEREYVEGMHWDRGLASRELAIDRTRVRSELPNVALFMSDLRLREAEDVLPILLCALRHEQRRLLIIADEISDSAMALLLTNNRKPEELQILAVKTPGYSAEEKAWFLEDIALVCGGRSFIQGAGDHARSLRPEQFGRARRAWTATETFGVIGGKGDPRRLRQHIAGLKHAYGETLDVAKRSKLEQRIGRLLGGSATLRIGGVSEHEIEARKERAERTAIAVRGALQEGVVPGGGAALLACRPALRDRLSRAKVEEEAAAWYILIDAVAAPMRAISENSGYDRGDVAARAESQGLGWGFNAETGELTDMAKCGVLDPVSVQTAAAYAGISGAALALTIDVLVHRQGQDGHAPRRTPAKRKQL